MNRGGRFYPARHPEGPEVGAPDSSESHSADLKQVMESRTYAETIGSQKGLSPRLRLKPEVSTRFWTPLNGNLPDLLIFFALQGIFAPNA